MVTQPWLDRRNKSLYPVALISILIVATARLVLENLKSDRSYIFQFYGSAGVYKQRKPVFVSSEDRFEKNCNVFEGEWIWDNVTYPIYTEESCPYLVKQTTCQRNGRPDSFYQNWRWQPSSCKLPRYLSSVYGERKGKLLTKEQKADPKFFADCIHWCLPGVPDSWNDILYAYLMQNHQNL